MLKKTVKHFLIRVIQQWLVLLLIPCLFWGSGNLSSDNSITQIKNSNIKNQISLPTGGGTTFISEKDGKLTVQRHDKIYMSETVNTFNHVITGTAYKDDTFQIEVLKNFKGKIRVEGGFAGFDVLSINGNETEKVIYNFENEHDGSVEYDFDGDNKTDFTIEYIGLEPIVSDITASDCDLRYSDGAETITITDAGGNITQVNSTLGELVTFVNPSNSMTLNAGSGNDIINISSFNSSWSADLNIYGDSGSDVLNINSSVNLSSGTMSVEIESMNTSAPISSTNGDFFFKVDNISLSGSLESSGFLSLIPIIAGTTIGIGGGAGTLNLSDTELAFLSDGFYDILIGDNSSGNITINTATFDDNVSLSTGGYITDGSGVDIGAPSVGLFGNVTPGGGSPGILSISEDFAFGEGGQFSVEIGGTSPGTSSNNHDQIIVGNNVMIGGNVPLSTTSFEGYSPSGSEEFTIISNNGSGAVVGTFSELPEGATISNDFLGSGLKATITYNGGDINDVAIIVGNPVPVELVCFSAQIIEIGKINLTWKTATEVNNYGFEVQRIVAQISNLSNRWETIGFVEGHGNSNSPKEYSYVDTNPINGMAQYRLKQIDIDGTFEYSDIVEVTNNFPTEYELSQNYPNPFNPSTTIKYSIPLIVNRESEGVEVLQATSVQLKIYDMLGQEVATLVNEEHVPGKYEVTFDASQLASGTYVYRIIANDFVDTKKLMLLK